MPLYEFECETCKLNIELIQHYSDPAPQCEVCKNTMIRVLSGGKIALDFKGKGFYKNDYPSKR